LRGPPRWDALPEGPLETLYPCCAGSDVHKKHVVVCVRQSAGGAEARREVRTFPAMTRDLLALADGLAERGVTPVAMASTGGYWKPVCNLLEGRFEVILVNAEHLQQVPGRKTAVKDWEGSAPLLQCGLRRASFVPPAPIRELRDLTRRRTQLIGERSAAANRLQQVLEGATSPWASVATDVGGVSGRALLEALVAGVADPAELAERARKRLREKIPALQVALHGRVTEHHRFLLQRHLEHGTPLDTLSGRLGARLEEVMAPFAEAVAQLAATPGVSQRVAETGVAEVGTDRGRFPTAAPLASWAGLCPGNNESAGKRRSGRTAKGSRGRRATSVPAAGAASHPRDTALAAPYRRLARRRGRQRALIALGHTLLGIIYHVLKKQVAYAELGGDYLERLEPERLARQLVKRLEQLGHKVTLEPQEAA
jgi:transposase